MSVTDPRAEHVSGRPSCGARQWTTLVRGTAVTDPRCGTHAGKMGAMDHGDLIDLALSEGERAFVRAALLEWSGPTRPTDELAAVMGFASAESLGREVPMLLNQVETGGALRASDWRRVLLAVELSFASDVVGSGLDFSTTSGIPDEESIVILRGVQRELLDRGA